MMVKRELTDTEKQVAALVGLAIEATHKHKTPVMGTHACCRCESLAEHARDKGQAEPPIGECESWLQNGRRYWAGTCRDCSDLEWAERWQAHYEKAKNDPLEQRRLTRLVHERESRGRKVPLHVGSHVVRFGP